MTANPSADAADTIGMVGLSQMGLPITKRLLAAGLTVIGYRRRLVETFLVYRRGRAASRVWRGPPACGGGYIDGEQICEYRGGELGC